MEVIEDLVEMEDIEETSETVDMLELRDEVDEVKNVTTKTQVQILPFPLTRFLLRLHLFCFPLALCAFSYLLDKWGYNKTKYS